MNIIKFSKNILFAFRYCRNFLFITISAERKFIHIKINFLNGKIMILKRENKKQSLKRRIR